MAGISGIAGAGQSMLDTQQRIQEVQEHLEQFPGDEQARLQLQHLQDGANLHTLLSGGLSAGASLLPVPGLSGATRGILPSVARQALAGTAQNVAQGVVQHGLIDPVRGDASDPFATVGPDTLFGLGGAIVHAGKDAPLRRPHRVAVHGLTASLRSRKYCHLFALISIIAFVCSRHIAAMMAHDQNSPRPQHP